MSEKSMARLIGLERDDQNMKGTVHTSKNKACVPGNVSKSRGKK